MLKLLLLNRQNVETEEKKRLDIGIKMLNMEIKMLNGLLQRARVLLR